MVLYVDLNILSVHFDNNKEKNIRFNQMVFNKTKVNDKVSFKLLNVEFMDNADVQSQNFSLIIIFFLVMADAILAIRLFDYLVSGLIDIYDIKRNNKAILAFERNKNTDSE